MNKKIFNQGSSLIEIVVATGVVSLILTAIAASLTYSIKLSAEARYRDLATQAASEAMEVMRREKALRSWSDFAAEFFNGSGGSYCLDNLPAFQGTISPRVCDSEDTLGLGVGQSFKRTAFVVLNTSGPLFTSIDVKIKVYWNTGDENDNTSDPCYKRCVELNQTFYQWE